VSAFAHLAAQAASGDPGDRLAALRLCVPGRIVFTTSFGLEDQAIAHLIFTRKLDVEVATLDTGRLFAATHRVWEATERRYGVRIPSWHPEPLALAAFVADAGIDGFYGSKQARLGCCNVRKVEPLNRALAGASAWVTGLRSDQSDGRGGVELAAWESDRSLVKFAPLFDWSRERVADFCAAQGVPVRVSDPGVLRTVAALLPPGAGPADARSAGGDRSGRRQTRQIARTRDGSSERAPD